MKLDTGIVFTKGTCFFVAAVSLQFAQALAQWANSGQLPNFIQWCIIIALCLGAGANAILSFLSGSYSDYVKGRANGSATGNTGTDTSLWKKALPTPTPADPPKTP